MAGKSNKIKGIIAWVIGIMFAIIIIVPCLLYVPIIQKGVKNLAISYVNNNTSMTMAIDRIMLKFPLNLNVKQTLILDENQDTMIYAGDVLADVKFMPLLALKVDIQSVELKDAVYKMVSEDSSMVLDAKVDYFKLENTDILLDKNEVNLGSAGLDGGYVNMALDTRKQKTAEEDTTAATAWLVNMDKVKMKNVALNMQMLPLIQSLNTKIGCASLNEGMIDLGKQKVKIGYFGVDRADVNYIYPTLEYQTANSSLVDSASVETAIDTALWTINANTLRLNDSHVIYAMHGATPIDGLDMNYLEISDINVAIDSLYNRGSEVKLSLAQLNARERCGVQVTSGQGVFAMDSKEIKAENVKLETMQSSLLLDALLGANFTVNDTEPIHLDLEAMVGLGEIGYLYPSIKSMLAHVPSDRPIEMSLKIDGSSQSLTMENAMLKMPGVIVVDANGNLEHLMNIDKLAANINFSGDTKNLNFAKPIMLSDTAMYGQIDFPEMRLNGTMAYSPNMANADLDLRLIDGEMVFKGKWDKATESYDAMVRMDSFPLQSILPLAQLNNISAKANIKGVGYDPFDSKTKIDAALSIEDITYEGKGYYNMHVAGHLDKKRALVDLMSKNRDCDLNMSLSCVLDTGMYEFAVDGNVNNVDLKAMRLSGTESKGKGRIVAFGTANITDNAYEVDMDLRDFKWILPEARYETAGLNASFTSSKDIITLSAQEDDMYIDFNASCGIDSFLANIVKCQKIFEYEIESKYFDADTLQEALPKFSCDMRVGKNNLMQQALSAYDVKMDEMAINLVNDSTIYMDGHVYGIESGTLVLDTVTLYATQKDKYISYNLHVGNRPGTNDEFAQVSLRGGIRGNAVGGLLEQQNIQGVQGFRFGVNAFLSDTVVNMKLFPKNLIIGYRNWTVNDSNIVAFNNIEREFEADLNLKSDSSFVSLKTTPNKEQKGQDDVLLSIGGVQISEWLKVSPYIPPMSGLLSADMKMKFDGKNILGGGISRLKGFKYNRKAVGDFAFKLGLELDPVKNYIRLASAFDVDGRKTIVARGSLNDTTSVYPYNITLTVDSLPLKVANPFIPGDMANLSGALNGSMNLVGSFTEPIINGYVQCAGAEINMPLFGSHLTLSDTKIPVDYSLITFDGFKVYGSNKNAINVDGYVDLLPLDNPKIDVSLKGNNVEFVNSKQRRKMEVFGKGYANLDATALGTMNDLTMDVDLTLLPTTNLTYVLQTDVSAISTQTDENMVKFISFADTAHSETDTLATPIVTSNFRLNTKLNIQQGSKFNVYLSNNGRDRVEIEGSGLLNYSQSSLGDMRLVGNYTLSEGFVRYTPPLLSEKLFEFTDGSYISWTGDVLNPTLNIKAVDEMKASVSQEGQDSRLVNFLVSLSVTNALNNMNLEFDLSTNDDVTVQNELLSMSPAQRSSQAINMLLYNTYTGQGAAMDMSGNPLYSFLNSQINRWAANTIKGVDLTLGVNQYDKTSGDATSKSTSYSYKISKSLFNDRFKIVVGGNYNPSGDSEDNFANSLLNDISFVYMLNQSGTMSVKLFRHTGYESILEGEVTETGGAFVMKRKLSTLKNFFRFGRFRRGNNKNVISQDTIVKLEESPILNKQINEK